MGLSMISAQTSFVTVARFNVRTPFSVQRNVPWKGSLSSSESTTHLEVPVAAWPTHLTECHPQVSRTQSGGPDGMWKGSRQ